MLAMRSAARTIAYLGPAGTYGEAAAGHFARRLARHVPNGDTSPTANTGRDIVLRPCDTIPGVYSAAREADYAVLPLENTLHGAVLDAVDCLIRGRDDGSGVVPTTELEAEMSQLGLGGSTGGGVASKDRLPASPTSPTPLRIVADTSLAIAHQLAGLRGAVLEEITAVRSHEQALGQCAAWLDKHLPNAKRYKTPSTAGALASVIADNDPHVAAICSAAAVEGSQGKAVVLAKSVQAVEHNYTRFVLLARSAPPPPPPPAGPRTAFYAIHDIAALSSLVAGGTLVAVHQRPAPPGTPGAFPRWALVEVRLDSGASLPDVPGAKLLGEFTAEEIPPLLD